MRKLLAFCGICCPLLFNVVLASDTETVMSEPTIARPGDFESITTRLDCGWPDPTFISPDKRDAQGLMLEKARAEQTKVVVSERIPKCALVIQKVLEAEK